MRQIRLVPFVLALLCFALPFAEVSCQGQKVASISGFDFALGKQIEVRDPTSGQIQKKQLSTVTGFAVALGCVVASILLGFVAGNAGKLLPGAAGVGGFISMIVGKADFDGQMLKDGQGMFVCQWVTGFFVACLLLLAGALLAGYQAFQALQQKPPATG